MNDWKEITIKDVALYIARGVSPKYSKEGTPIINQKCIRNGLINLSLVKYQDIKKGISPLKRLVNGDILINSTGVGTAGRVSIFNLNGEFTADSHVTILRCNDKVDPNFIFYNLRKREDEIESICEGSTGQIELSRERLSSLDIMLPSFIQQKMIVEVLSSLDDKVDLLHQNNKTLEQLAETLFRQWFVEEVKEEWSEVKLGSYISLVSGYSYRSVDLNNSTKALVTLKNFERTGGFRHDGFKEYTGKYKDDQVVVSGDLIVAHTDITQDAEVLGNPAIVISSSKYETLIISTDLVKVVPTSYLSKVYLYFLMKTDEFKHYCLGNSNGTTVLHLSKKALPGFDLKLPPPLFVEKFTVIAEPLLEKINTNQKHIQQLENLRDSLLPKLMSGFVKVEN